VAGPDAVEARGIATHVGDQYATTITIGRGVDASSVRLGHTLPRGSYPASVVLDGRAVQNYRVTQTNRGVEVTVATTPGQHTLRITT